MATTDTTQDYLFTHRVERFCSLGFDSVDAMKLAEINDKRGFPLYWGDVQRALDAGCSHSLALLIFL